MPFDKAVDLLDGIWFNIGIGGKCFGFFAERFFYGPTFELSFAFLFHGFRNEYPVLCRLQSTTRIGDP